MRFGPIASLAVLFALPVSAANIRFDPPNPTSATPVIAHVLYRVCGVVSATATRSGNIIGITITESGGCIPEIGRSDIAVNLGVLPPGVYDVVASPGNLLVGIAEGILPVRDAAQPFSIKPDVAKVSGGPVRINGANVAGCPSGSTQTICAPDVKFGDVAATNVRPTSTDEIVVDAPPHDPGVVDITLQKGAVVLRAPAAFHYFDGEPNAAFFERVLVPVFFSGPGAHGSQWRTEAAMYNADDYPIDAAGTPLFRIVCVVDPCDERPPAQATTFGIGQSVPTGVVTFLPRYAMSSLHFSLLVRDLSRDATDFGTSVPVVRESEMFNRAFALVNVPTDPRYRLGLRLYAYDTIPTVLRVEMTAGGTVVFRDVPLLPARDHAFAFIGDLLAEHPTLVGKGPLRIVITPTETATRAWGYVSLTNNDTQHVTVIAPE